ncbi:hypothetical protein LguiB_023922 [Lonicera macranthoides]
MGAKEIILLLALFALILVHVSHGQEELNDPDPSEDPLEDIAISRDDFPKDFIFGTSSAAYQFEGAAYEDGKGNSTWDVFTATYPDRIKDNSSGAIAADFYHRYEEDLPVMNYLGFNAFRFSISWPRIVPNGTIHGKIDGMMTAGVNHDGVNYYNKLINESIKNGQEPFVTIFHWDLPQALEDEYLGFLNETIVDDFSRYAELCFQLFGDRVKNWVTINEPWSYSTMGYAQGLFPPNRCTPGLKINPALGFSPGRFASYAEQAECKAGNSGTEPYIVSHHLLLSHATAVDVYRKNYQKSQKGQIGISLCTQWYKPRNTSYPQDQYAKDRAIAFMYGWFMEPLVNGTYPEQMIKHVGNRLPTFSTNQSKLVKGSADFIGLNYYTAQYVADMACFEQLEKSYMTDPCVFLSNVSSTGEPIGKKTYLDWLYIYPDGIRDILNYGNRTYNNPPIYITENGVARHNLGDRPHDLIRKRYHKHHMALIPKLIKEGVNVKGYFIWSYMDNFDWLAGYTVNYGLIYVDQKNNTLNRSCKDSALWYKDFLGSNKSLDFNTTYTNCERLKSSNEYGMNNVGKLD